MAAADKDGYRSEEGVRQDVRNELIAMADEEAALRKLKTAGSQ